jgi:hypothetical protein
MATHIALFFIMLSFLFAKLIRFRLLNSRMPKILHQKELNNVIAFGGIMLFLYKPLLIFRAVVSTSPLAIIYANLGHFVIIWQ